MEDVLKFLVIIAAIAIGIAQQYKKEAKKKASATPHPHPAAETETHCYRQTSDIPAWQERQNVVAGSSGESEADREKTTIE